jgi:enterochelin esterase-like enzyme
MRALIKRILLMCLAVMAIAACSQGARNRAQANLPEKATIRPAATPAPEEPEASSPTPTAGIPSPQPTGTPCGEAAGQMLEMTYPGTAVNGEIPLRVYLPPCFSEGMEYPSIYLLHGSPFDETQWETLGVVRALESGMRGSEWPAVLLVMPLVPEPLFTRSDGGNGSYETEMVEGLVPFIDGHFSTVRDADQRALIGLSRGGVWALEIAFRTPELFNVVVGVSPSLSVNHARPEYDPLQIVQGEEPLPDFILLTGGTGEPGFLQGIEKLVGVLQAEGINHVFMRTSGAHNDEAWMDIVDDVLAFVMEGFQRGN